MHAHLSALVLLSALSGGTREATVYTDYKQAWQAGRSQKLPVLVILNPSGEADSSAIDFDALRKTGHRRELLGKYVVAVIDASTPEGKQVRKAFGSPSLPRVSVLDREQKWQVYRTSQQLTAEDWNIVLETHQKGNPPAVAAKPAACRT